MTRSHTRARQIIWTLAIAACVLAGCARPPARPAVVASPRPVTTPGDILPARTTPRAVQLKATAPAPTLAPPATAPAEQIHAVEAAPTQPSKRTLAPTGLASGEKTVTIGSEMVDCPGAAAGSAQCYLVREQEQADWAVFNGTINGFEFWPGAEYTMVIKEDKTANPAPGRSDVVWTVLKGLYKTNVPRTPAAAP